MNNINEDLDNYYIPQSSEQDQLQLPTSELDFHPQVTASYQLDFNPFYSDHSTHFHEPIDLHTPSMLDQSLFHKQPFLEPQPLLSERPPATGFTGSSSTNPFGYNNNNNTQENLLLNDQDPNELMSNFGPLSTFYTQPRQEQDIFSELINLAKANNGSDRSSKELSPHGQHKLDKFHKPSNAEVSQRERLVYDLKIVQQPARARMCGFGDKDRRPIVPAPILQLFVTDREGHDVDPEAFDVTFLVVLCDSCLQTGEPATSASNNSKMGNSVPVSQVVVFSSSDDNKNPRTSRLKNLVGSSVVSANKLYDLDDKLGIFFIFHDISLRTEGTFRLKFSLVDVGSPYAHSVNTEALSQVIKSVYSDPFTVYTAKKYPGVVQASPLSICFARQGIKIPVRKDPSGLKNKKKDTRD
ncbi:hypothetical protein G6F37_001558 [Rhizopus arrhizus]|nr:hypothetical protein G6F38_000354 [Rhizopus arrhizus]KAG1163073.1 hypothetical protein G6F37_001558 [Rhizopus arrhizus]